MKDIIPTRDKLSRYKPEIDVHCSLCNYPAETIDHLFLKCPYARSIWLAVNINVGTILTHHGSFRNWVISWFSAGTNITFGSNITRQDINNLLMVAAWTIWKDRCSKVFQNINPNRLMSLDNINNLSNSNVQQVTNVIRPLQDIKWVPPDNDCLKFNIDASFKKETLQGGVGLIVRDFVGTCIGVKGIYIDGGMKDGIEVEELECKALKDAVNLAVKMKLKKVIFESDGETLIKSINEPDSYVHWMNQTLILDIKFLLSSLEYWRCVSVRRKANCNADKLAKRARVMRASFSHGSDLPHEIQVWIDQRLFYNELILINRMFLHQKKKKITQN
ncbi:uncharacterized protein LOC113271874 [Papaver somniferum]|uniref:uncharacterized protein LOC113271874 n=1 Tax=Papaver somniferum TaxID=3469 RepID=UPI000E6FDC7E|nr:uncharacterized protein LOC113271874 [Papaver somniferum]